MSATNHDALLDDLILEDLIDQEIAALSGGTVYPIPRVTLDRYVIACRNQPEFPFALDEWQLDLSARLEKAFWTANAKKFDFLTKLVKGNKSMLAPSGFVIDIGEFKEYENIGTNAAIHGPPQFGKTIIISTDYPAWMFGYDPLHRFRLAMYGMEHAQLYSVAIRRRLFSPEHKSIFTNPAGHLPAITRIKEWSTNARLKVNDGQHSFIAMGLDSGFVGTGVDCFPAGTMISTEWGPIDIAVLHWMRNPPRVWAFDHAQKRPVLKRIEASRAKVVSQLVEVTTNQGRIIYPTPEHRVWASDDYQCSSGLKKGQALTALPHMSSMWQFEGSQSETVPSLQEREHASVVQDYLSSMWLHEGPGLFPLSNVFLAQQEGLENSYMRSLWQILPQAAMRDTKASPQRTQEALLLDRLRHCVSVGAPNSPSLQKLRNGSKSRPELLLPEVRRRQGSGAHRKAPISATETMQGMRDVICPQEFALTISQQRLCQCLSLPRNDRQRQFALQDRDKLRALVRLDATVYLGARSQSMCGMSHSESNCDCSQRSATEHSACSPHRCQPAEQSRKESDHSLQALSQDSPSIEADSVAMVRRLREEEVTVYDIQVEDCHNFFANEILVHNCLVQDDPYRSPEKARSPKIRDTTWRFQTETAQPRMLLHTNNFVMHHRYHNDDQGGRAIASGRFKLWRYAAIADGDYVDEATGIKYPCLPLGRKKGEPLSKRDIYPPWYYENKKREDPDVWNAQFQGRPTTKEGTFFDTSKITVLTAAQFAAITLVHEARAWDNASTPKSGDFTAGGRVGVDAMSNFYLHNMRRDQVDTAGRQQLQELAAIDDGLMIPILFPQDPAAGADVAYFFRQEYEPRGYTVVVHKVAGEGSKTLRADEFSKVVNGGKFYVVVNEATEDDPKGEKGPYLSPEQWKVLKAELRDFPMVGLYDDQVDCIADAVNHLKKLFLKGRVVKVNGDDNVLPWPRFVSRFGERIPAHWEVAIAARISANSSLPSGWAMVARAGENAQLGEVVFIVASTRKYVRDPGIILNDIKDAVQIYCAGGEKQVQAVFIGHGKGAMAPDAIMPLARDKFDLALQEFPGDEELGLTETAWYMQTVKAPNPFYDPKEPQAQGREASRCYILSDIDQVESAKNENGQLSLRQDMLNWSYNDEGKPQPFGGIVLDCVRMTLYNFWLTATGLTAEERRYAKLPKHLQNDALREKLGTEEYVTDKLAQMMQLGRIAEREREQESTESGRFTGTRRRERFRR